MKAPFPDPVANSRVEGSSSAARSGHHGGARSVSPPEEREYPSAASAPPPMPDPHYGDDLAYADYWEHRL